MVAHVDVFIVGAGPVGLTLANLLANYGISFRIIDKYPAPLVLSKAAALHARTLEALDTVGVTERLLAEGVRVETLTLRTLYKDAVRFPFNQLDNTRYPFILDIPQYRTEELLIDRLAEQGFAVERERLLTDFSQSTDGVTVTIEDTEGQIEQASATYLVGADGAKSTVRRLLGFDFVGDDYADPWVLFDAELDWAVPRNEMTFSSSEDGIYGVFPLPDNVYRVAYTQNHDAHGNPIEPTFDDAQEMMKITGIDGKIREITSKFWVFNLQHRQVDDYRHGNVLLLGDSAHIHTPFGGQGLNLGLIDAFNLGWKLAMVIKEQANTSLLDTYQEERHPIGQQVVRSTHIGASSMLLREPSLKRSLREGVMGILNKVAPIKRRIVHTMAQLNHSYKGTSIVSGSDGQLRGGQRLPNYAFAINGNQQDLYQLLDTSRHTLFLVGDKLLTLYDIATRIQAQHADTLSIRIITTQADSISNDNPAIEIVVDEQGQLKLKENTAYLIRPDQMIGKILPVDEVMNDLQRLYR